VEKYLQGSSFIDVEEVSKFGIVVVIVEKPGLEVR